MIVSHLLAIPLLMLAGTVLAEEPSGVRMEAPTLPHIAKNVCPFEGCVYREWTALKDMPVYDTWQGKRRQTATLPKGEKVKAIGGIVITDRPGVIHLERDVPESKLRRGDTILTYGYTSEGFSSVWINGRFYESFDISFTKWPDGSGCGGAHCAATFVDLGKKAWWTEVKLRSGETASKPTPNLSMGTTCLLASPK